MSVGAAAPERPEGRRHRDRVVGDVHDRRDRRAEPFDLGPDARLEPLASRAVDRFLHQHADPPGPEAGHAHDRAAGPGDCLAAPDDRLRDELRGDLHARHEVARPDDLAVVDRERLEWVDPVEALQRRDPDAHDTVHGGQQVDPALGRPAQGDSRTGDGRGEPEGGLVLVEVARLRDEQRSSGGSAPAPATATGRSAARRARSSAVRRRPFDQRSPPTRTSRGRTAPTRSLDGGRPATRRSRRTPSASGPDRSSSNPAQPSAASAPSTARRTYTVGHLGAVCGVGVDVRGDRLAVRGVRRPPPRWRPRSRPSRAGRPRRPMPGTRRRRPP